MMWVLIVSFATTNGGLAITTQEFNSQVNCEGARASLAQMVNNYREHEGNMLVEPGRVIRSTNSINSVCVLK